MAGFEQPALNEPGGRSAAWEAALLLVKVVSEKLGESLRIPGRPVLRHSQHAGPEPPGTRFEVAPEEPQIGLVVMGAVVANSRPKNECLAGLHQEICRPLRNSQHTLTDKNQLVGTDDSVWMATDSPGAEKTCQVRLRLVKEADFHESESDRLSGQAAGCSTIIKVAKLSGMSALQVVPFTRVCIDDEFWRPRREVNRRVTLREEYRHLVETHRIDALRMDWHSGLNWTPHEFWDSDTAKWVEAAAYCLAEEEDPELRGWMEEVVDLIVAAQQSDGYVNSYITQVCPADRWKNLRDKHELYGLGHLIEAAVAHFQVTGNRRFLDAMVRCADYLAATFGTMPGQIPGYCGHQEIELALFRLAGVTGEDRFAALAEYFLNQRGQQPHYFVIEAEARGDKRAAWSKMHVADGYSQAHVPIREQHRVVGHAVRAIYMYTAMADLAARRPEDRELAVALDELWSHLMERNAYITGGVGSSKHNEGFTRDYDLPNETAYCETCASAALIFWAQRMLHRKLDGRYADAIEAALFNTILHGVSQDGKTFYYDNRLAEVGDHPRSGWFWCSCCPPNLARVIASVGSYGFSSSGTSLVLHQYFASSLSDDFGRRLRVETRYPWEGKVVVILDDPAGLGELVFRVPGWAGTCTLTINGESVAPDVVSGYASLRCQWRAGDVIDISFPFEPRTVFAHPLLEANANRAAICRGPLVYAFEQPDHDVPVALLRIPGDGLWIPSLREVASSRAVVLEAEGKAASCPAHGALYSQAPASLNPTRLTAIPYFLTGNRPSDHMRVWIPLANRSHL